MFVLGCFTLLLLSLGSFLVFILLLCVVLKDENAVVCDQLKVHGIKNLRVIDASVMPYITSGNTNAPTIMIAEKGADMILQK